MRTLASRLGPAVLLALAVAAAPVQAASPAPLPPMPADATAAIDAGIAAIMAKHPEVPAIYIGVWDPARGAYQQAYGLADVAGKRAASLDDHFRIGSVSKTFMATIILQLVDEGRLKLDDTVADVDPDLAAKHPNLAAITIEQLLGMTSGIPDYMNVPDAAVADLGTWAASMSGSSTLSDALAEARLGFHDADLTPMLYGLGLIRFGNQVGHEGEAIGWEGWVGQDPQTGLRAVVFTTTCSDSAVVFQALGVIDPGFAPTAATLFGPP